MLRYLRERHLDRLKDRLAVLSSEGVGHGSRIVAGAGDVTRGQVEELMRELMVRHLAAVRKMPHTPLEGLAPALRAFLSCCDPGDLRQVDVLHNLYEATTGASRDPGLRALLLDGYAGVIRAHIERLAAAAIRPHQVGTGEPAPIAEHGPALRVLLLADNFLVGARVWRAVARDPALSPRILFCNHRPGDSSYLPRLGLSLARVVARGWHGAALSMLRSGPRFSHRPLTDPSNTTWLRASSFDVGLHAMGVIYRAETIFAFKLGILNAHIGHLPGMRGRSVLEWSLVFAIEPCISTFLIDEGIDTGELIVDRRPPPMGLLDRASSIDAAKRRLFELDGSSYARALETLARGGQGFRNVPAGPRFYVMSRLLSGAISAS